MMPKERPIIFGAESVRAILEGRKTQTRRVIKPQPDVWFGSHPYREQVEERSRHDRQYRRIACPYGQPGDRLWVREAFGYRAEHIGMARTPSDKLIYRADHPNPGKGWRSPIFMPRAASRLTLEVVGVRGERLHDITEEGAVAEGGLGYEETPTPAGWIGAPPTAKRQRLPVGQFAQQWNEINAKRGHPWESNPWVWVVEFERVDAGAEE